jgi:hypothetical protein
VAEHAEFPPDLVVRSLGVPAQLDPESKAPERTAAGKGRALGKQEVAVGKPQARA